MHYVSGFTVTITMDDSGLWVARLSMGLRPTDNVQLKIHGPTRISVLRGLFEELDRYYEQKEHGETEKRAAV